MNCNLCGAPPTSFATIATRDRYGLPTQTCICTRCSHCFLYPRWSAAEYATFYRSGEYRRQVERLHGRTETPEELEAGQRAYAQALLRFTGAALEPYRGGTLLDIGGSTGVVARAFCDRYGMDGVVLDPAADEVAIAANRYGLRGFAGLIEDLPQDVEAEWSYTFDVVLLCQTIDHLLDVAGTLRKIHKLLKPGGTLVADCVEFWNIAKDFNLVTAIKVDHPNNFCRATAAAFLMRAGFVVEPESIGHSVHEKPKRSRKSFFICQKGEPVAALPEAGYVANRLKELGIEQ